jgi:hypothetical protein
VLALAKLVGVSKIFCLLDVAAPSPGLRGAGLTTSRGGECAARVAPFDNLGDHSSPDVCKTLLPIRGGEKRATPLPSISS